MAGDWTVERLMGLRQLERFPASGIGEATLVLEGFPMGWRGSDGRRWDVQQTVAGEFVRIEALDYF